VRFPILAMLFAVLAVGRAEAHPHVWVDAASEILFDASGRIEGVRHHWRFDEAFSAFAAQGLDEDGDGALTREELQPLAQVNVESLSEYAFFTFLTAGGGEAKFGAPEGYWLEQMDGRLVLHFTLPLAEPIAAKGEVTLDVYDPEYFVAFSLPSEKAVRLTDAPAGCTLNVSLAKELDASAQEMLAQIGPDQRELPADLKALTEGPDNSATVTCP
jgi:ABC-type uncharacterized transport system substrate-binding protein